MAIGLLSESANPPYPRSEILQDAHQMSSRASKINRRLGYTSTKRKEGMNEGKDKIILLLSITWCSPTIWRVVYLNVQERYTVSQVIAEFTVRGGMGITDRKKSIH